MQGLEDDEDGEEDEGTEGLTVREGVAEDNKQQVELASKKLEEVESHREEKRTRKVSILMEANRA